MSEQSVDFFSSLEAEQQSAFARKLNGELDQNLIGRFEESLAELIEFASRDVPPVSITELVARTGPQGVLPPPEKRMAAIEILSGRDPAVTREFVGAEQTGEMERPIELAELHFITEVNPTSLVNTAESEDIATLLNWFGRMQSIRDRLVETDEGVELRIKKFGGFLHIISRGAIGNISYDELPLINKAGIDQAARVYTGSFREVVNGQGLNQISDDFVAHELLTRQIGEKIKQPRQRGVLRLPIFIAPKSYQSQQKTQYRPLISSTPFITEIPSILIYPGKDPQAGILKPGLGFVPLKESK